MATLNLSPEEINATFPICGLRVSRGGIIVRRYSDLSILQIKKLHLRGVVQKLSRRSLSNFAWMVANSKVEFLSMLTLTYGQNFPLSGARCKDDFRAFMMVMRRTYGAFSYAWFMEFQQRGAPHFHVLLTLQNPTDSDRHIVASGWSRIVEPENFAYSGLRLHEGKLIRWSSGFTRDAVRKFNHREKVWENVREKQGAIRYCIMYATKSHQKQPPRWFTHTGRFWGCSRDVPNRDDISFSASEQEVRELCAILGRNLDNWKVLPKIILINGQGFDKFYRKADNELNK